MNRSTDAVRSVRILDAAGVPADEARYPVPESGRSLELVAVDRPGIDASAWRVTLGDIRATPGLPNQAAIPPATTVKVEIGPSTACDTASVSIDLPSSDVFLTVRVYDRLGREVRRLIDGQRYPAHSMVAWDGCDGAGRPMPTGAYVVLVEAAEATSGRVVAGYPPACDCPPEITAFPKRIRWRFRHTTSRVTNGRARSRTARYIPREIWRSMWGARRTKVSGNPEQMLLGAVEVCLAATFFSIARMSKLTVASWRSTAAGEVEFVPKEGYRYKGIVIRPVVTVAESDIAKATDVMERAHRFCLISRSVNFPIEVEPEFVSG